MGFKKLPELEFVPITVAFPAEKYNAAVPANISHISFGYSEILVVNEVFQVKIARRLKAISSKWDWLINYQTRIYILQTIYFPLMRTGVFEFSIARLRNGRHNYTVKVELQDDRNASYNEDFKITLTKVIEDLDGDGTEDYYDDDIDGDGLTNAEELLYNSDPWDASSSNRPPSDINASNLTIAENSAIGTVIGEFNATDPDGVLNVTYQMLWATPKEVTRQKNLLAWFKFDEVNGSVAENFGPVGSSGSLVDGALFERSEYKFGGGALKIPAASTARVTLDSAVWIGGEESGYFSSSVWFKNLHDRSGGRVLAHGEEFNAFTSLKSGNDNLGLWQSNNGEFRDSGYDLNVSSTLEWTNLVASFDGSSTKFFINSVAAGTCDRSPGTPVYGIGNGRNWTQPF